MKKIFGFIVVLLILILAFQLGIIELKRSHSIEYGIKINDKKFIVNEKYIKKGSNDYYLFEVNIGNNSMVFDVPNKFNKQKKVINSFKMYQEGHLLCISPIYIKNNDESIVVCNINKEQVSISYVKDKTNYNIDDFLKSLDNFNFDKFISSDITSTIGKSNIYKDNMYDDEIIIVYDYKDLVKITKKQNNRISFSNYDVYYNKIGTLIDNYYILPGFLGKPEYSNFLIIDINTGEKEIVKFDKAISTNIYINGIVDNKLYFFDKSNLVQYELNPAKRTYRIVGNKETNGQYYDGEWSNRNIYDFYNKELKYICLYPIKNNYIKVFETNKYYYYYNSKNEIYKVYKEKLDNPILLFQYDDIKEIKVVEGAVYFINDNTIYRYDDTGIKKIITNNEFKYNYENIYSVYIK